MTKRSKPGRNRHATILRLAGGQLRLRLEGHRRATLLIPTFLIYGALLWIAARQQESGAATTAHPLVAVAVIAALCHPVLIWWMTAQGYVFDARRSEIVHWRRGPMGVKRQTFPWRRVSSAVCEHQRDSWTVTLKMSPRLGTSRLPILRSKHPVEIDELLIGLREELQLPVVLHGGAKRELDFLLELFPEGRQTRASTREMQAAAVMILSSYFVLANAYQVVFGHRSKAWPKVSGTVVSASIESIFRPQMILAFNEDHPEDSPPVFAHTLRIVYRYPVGDTVYTAERVAFGGPVGTRKEVQPALERYRRGQPVTVYFDPGRPQRACLERGILPSKLASVTFALLFTCASAGFMLFFRHQRRRGLRSGMAGHAVGASLRRHRGQSRS